MKLQEITSQQTIEVDGIIRSKLNNLGQPIHKTEEGIINFWKWFGNSKVIDNTGRPLVVHHGTSKKFKAFNPKLSLGIIWFTSNEDTIKSGEAGAAGRDIIMPLYAKIISPAGWKDYDNLLLAQFKGHGFDGAILPSGEHFDGFVFSSNQLKSIKNKGTYSTSNKVTEES